MTPRLVLATREVPHPHLRGRKPIVARMLVARGLDVRARSPEGPEERVALAVMRDDGRRAADDPFAVTDDRTKLDAHLHTTRDAVCAAAERARGHAARTAGPARLRMADQAVERIVADAATIDCGRCGARHGHVCDGTEGDERVMRDDPECWRGIGDLVQFAMRETERTYAQVLPDFAGGPRARLYFTTRAAREGAPVACTAFPPEDRVTDRCADVTLTLPIADFGHDAYFGLAYQVFHEVFVHVPQAIALPGRRAPFGSDCPMTEGMLDEAAYRTMGRALGRARHPDTFLPAGMRPHAASFVRRAGHQHEERSRLDFESRGRTTREVLAREARAFGRALYEKLVDHRGGERGEEWALGLALRLNVDLTDGACRKALMFRIDDALSTPVSPGTANLLGDLDELLERGPTQAILSTLRLV